jgi:hypothetical protein
MDLQKLSDPKYWELLRAEDSIGELFGLNQTVEIALEYLPKFATLVKQEYVDPVKNESDELPIELIGRAIISVIVVEESNEYSTPDRLVHVLNSMSLLYSAVAELDGDRDTDLIVLACDSGSDKSFDFLGLAKTIEGVKEILVGLWDRVVMYRHDQVKASIELVAQSLPVIVRVNTMASSGLLEPEQAEMIRRKLINGATKFLEAGAITEDMDRQDRHSPRALMRPERKLLAAPSSGEQRSSSNRNGEIIGEGEDGRAGGLSDWSTEDISKLRTLLRDANVKPDEPVASKSGSKAGRRRPKRS